MGFTDKSGSPFAVNGLNAMIRIVQLVFAAVVVGIYAHARADPTYQRWERHGYYYNKFEVGVAAGALAMITSLVFGLVPFLISYYYVAIAFIWDWIIVFVYAGSFGYQHAAYGPPFDKKQAKDAGIPDVDSVVAGQWFLLAGLLLQVVSGVMGPLCLLMDRKSLCGTRSRV